jgi:hypothetical protein
MDEDIHRALFDDAEDGEFETLDDDFVSQVCYKMLVKDFTDVITCCDKVIGEPEEPDFDFDAHLSKLLKERYIFLLCV